MALAIWLLCAATSFSCAVLLLRSFVVSRRRLLLWSGLCFAGLTANNLLLILDHSVFLQIDLLTPRLVVALGALLLMLYGLVWESE